MDLVFIHNSAAHKETDGPRPIDSTTFYARLGQRIIHILTTQTASGALYEVDMRLRPSGSSGLLVSSLKSFEKYQREDAWTWEHQALVRARAVAGDNALAEEFDAIRKSVLSTRRDTQKLKTEVVEMRQKMRSHLTKGSSTLEKFDLKHDKGGIVDIEFLMQYAVLRYGHDHPLLLRWTDNIRISEAMEEVGLVSPKDAYWLREAYKTFRLALHQRALQYESPVTSIRGADHLSDKVVEIWDRTMR